MGIPGFGATPGDVPTLHSMMAEDSGFLDAVDLPIIVISRDCRVIRINRAATTVLGLTVADIGRPLPHNLVGLENLDRLCGQVMAEGTPSRRETREGDRSFLLRIAPYGGTEGQPLGAVLTVTNVTAFRASIAQAVYEREYTKAILNTVIDPLVVLDSELRVQTANRSFFTMFGVSRDETQGISIRKLGNSDWATSEVWKSIEAMLSKKDGGETVFAELEMERDFPSLGRRTVVLDARRLARDGDLMILLAFQDVTERKQAEQELRKSEERYRVLAEALDAQVQLRTEQLEQRNLEVLQQAKQLRSLSNRLLQTQDEERRRVARELHDGVGQVLAAVRMNFRKLEKERYSLSLEARQSLVENAMFIDQALQEVRTVSHLLHPPMLDEIGLESAVRWYVKGFAERSQVAVTMQLSPGFSKSLPREMALCLFRIVQECLTNIHRHSGSKTALVEIHRSETEITLEVKDEGAGISAPVQKLIASGGGTGVGLRGMRERIQRLGGRLKVESNEKGTRIGAVLPLNERVPSEKDETPRYPGD